jgi:hypothetical protein
MGPRNRFQGMNSANLCSLAGRYDNPLPPWFLAPIDSLKIPAQAREGDVGKVIYVDLNPDHVGSRTFCPGRTRIRHF